jgi:hypothetical protein
MMMLVVIGSCLCLLSKLMMEEKEIEFEPIYDKSAYANSFKKLKSQA